MSAPRLQPITGQSSPETARLAELIGYHLASVCSGNNMPHMSGDPRNRIPPGRRRHFDDACLSAAEAVVSSFGLAQTPALPDLLKYANHLTDCRYRGGHDCDCGLDEIRSAALSDTSTSRAREAVARWVEEPEVKDELHRRPSDSSPEHGSK